MSQGEFRDFLRALKNESGLSIEADWKDVRQARALKAFLDDYNTSVRGAGQERHAAIRATRKQMREEINIFESGVKWIEVPEE